MKEAIRDEYLSKQKKRAEAVVRAVRDRCRAAGISPPAANTVRARVRRVRADKAARVREGSGSAAAHRLTPVAGETPPATQPMAILQVDHTPVDLILVDETWRKPIGRPWLSVAIDTYSRCVAGLHLSYEAPSATVAGLCIAQDKTAYLRGHYGYFGMPHNWRYLNGFLQEVRRIWFNCLRRRSQKNRRMGWDWFEAVTAYLPLPQPRITHPWTPRVARCGCFLDCSGQALVTNLSP